MERAFLKCLVPASPDRSSGADDALLHQLGLVGHGARKVERLADSTLYSTADMGPSEVEVICKLDATGKQLMKSAMRQMSLSARAFHRILKLSRTTSSGTAQPSQLCSRKI